MFLRNRPKYEIFELGWKIFALSLTRSLFPSTSGVNTMRSAVWWNSSIRVTNYSVDCVKNDSRKKRPIWITEMFSARPSNLKRLGWGSSKRSSYILWTAFVVLFQCAYTPLPTQVHAESLTHLKKVQILFWLDSFLIILSLLLQNLRKLEPLRIVNLWTSKS